MKKLISLLFLTVLLCINNTIVAQSRGEKFMSQAQKHLDNKEYIQARYNFVQAFSQFASDSVYDKAVDAGVKAAALYHRENYYKEAFEQLGKVDRMLLDTKVANPSNATLMYLSLIHISSKCGLPMAYTTTTLWISSLPNFPRLSSASR